MKIARFVYKGKITWGEVVNNFVRPFKKDPFGKIERSSSKIPVHKCNLLAPATPSKVVLVGLNYTDHARELKMALPKEPIIFLKPNSSLVGDKDKIIYPKSVTRLDYEAELAVVIGKKAKSISVKNAKKYILGYTCLNDVTARDLQKKDTQWTRAKSFDTFCPLGPWLETDLDPSKIKIKSYLNGTLKQNSSTTKLIFSVYELVSFISNVMTLSPGDIIATGTPSGIGRMKRGDTVQIEIEHIGRLTNYVK